MGVANRPEGGAPASGNRRALFRLAMHDHPCTMRVVEVGGKPVTLPPMSVAMVDLSGGGCMVRTDLDLPIRHTVLCDFSFRLQGVDFRFLGEIMTKIDDRRSYKYGVAFQRMTEVQRDRLVGALNMEQIERHKRGLEPG